MSASTQLAIAEIGAAEPEFSAISPANRNTSCWTMADRTPKSAEVPVAHVDSVNQNPPGGNVVKAVEQLDDGGFAANRSARRSRSSVPPRRGSSSLRSTGSPLRYSKLTWSKTIAPRTIGHALGRRGLAIVTGVSIRASSRSTAASADCSVVYFE